MLEGQTESFQNFYVITVSVCLAMTVLLYLRRVLTPTRAGRLLRLLYGVLVGVMLCDLSWALTERIGVQSVLVSYVCNAAWFVLFTVLSLMWFALFNRQMRDVRLRGRAQWAVFLVPAAVTVLMTLASAVTHWIVDVTPSGCYHRGPYFGVAYVSYMFYAFSAVALSLLNALRAKTRSERRYCLNLALVSLPFLAMMALQVLMGVNFGFAGLIFSLAMYDTDSERRIAEMESDMQGELERLTEERERDRSRLEAESDAKFAKEQTLSLITKQLYGFDLSVDIEEDTFSLIVGTGMESIVDELASAHSYREAYEKIYRSTRPAHRDALRELISLDYLRNAAFKTGLTGRCECASGEGENESWYEVNVIMGNYGRGKSVANILVRNVTDERRAAAAREREIKVAMAKDQILSGITQAIYGFNLTIDLENDTYSVIRGTGLERLVRLVESMSGGPYSAAVDKVLAYVGESERSSARSILGRDYLLAFRGRRGLVASREISFVGGDGRKGWCEVLVFMGADGAGSPIANVLGRDVTATHERQEQREREMKAVAAKDQILSGITQAIYGYNLTVNIKTLRYTLITGTGMESVCEVFRATDDYAEAFISTLGFVDSDYTERVANFLAPEFLRRKVSSGRIGFIGSFEYRATVDGHVQWHETNVFIGTDEHGDPIANILGRNITEVHEQSDTERRLLVAEQSNAAKTSFLFSMSHDIRTPMNAIIGYVAMARKYAENPATRDCLEKINVAGQHLLSLINQVLEMSRIESGKVSLELRSVDLLAQARSTETIVAAAAGQKGVALESRFGRIAHPNVTADPDRLCQVLVNILGNAVKYPPEGGRVVFSVNEEPGTDGESNYVMSVEDTGIGMSKEFQTHIFEAFARENTTTVSGIQGSGLGMSIVKRLLDMMGGTIEISSKRGVGTKVVVTVPLGWSESNVGAKGRDGAPAAFSLSGRRVLLVEDNEMNREIANWMLTEQGAKVDEAVDGREAVEKFRAGAYDYVLMDIQMPVMNGYDATRAMREIEASRGAPRTPIVALSANAFEEDRRRSLEAGMDEHLSKPIRASDLAAALGRLS